MRWALFILLLFTGAFAANATLNISVASSESFPVYMVPEETKSVIITLNNTGDNYMNFTLHVKTKGTIAYVDDKASTNFTITDLASGATSAHTVTIKVLVNASFSKSDAIDIYVYDNQTVEIIRDWFYLETPDILRIEGEYHPVITGHMLSVNATAYCQNNTNSTNINVTYEVYNESGSCLSGNLSGFSGDINVTDCVGIYDIDLNTTSGGDNFTYTFNNFYLVSNITIEAEMFVQELFGYERPWAELPRIKSESTIIIYGNATYPNGKTVAESPDTGEHFVNLSIDTVNFNQSNRLTGGNFRLSFTAPINTSNYTLDIDVGGLWGLTRIKSMTLPINSTVQYRLGETEEESVQELILINTSDILELSETKTFNVTITNGNTFEVSGRMELKNNDWLQYTAKPYAAVAANSNKTYEFIVSPKAFVEAGNYSVDFVFATNIYGDVEKSYSVKVLETAEAQTGVTAKRFVNYETDRVWVRVTNHDGTSEEVTLKEEISEYVIVDLSEYTATGKKVEKTPTPNTAFSGIGSYNCTDTEGNDTVTYWIHGALVRKEKGNDTHAYVNGKKYTDSNGTWVDEGDGAVSTPASASCVYAVVTATNFTGFTVDPVFIVPPTSIDVANRVVSWDLELGAGESFEIELAVESELQAAYFGEPELFEEGTALQIPTPDTLGTPATTGELPGNISTGKPIWESLNILVLFGFVLLAFGAVVMLAVDYFFFQTFLGKKKVSAPPAAQPEAPPVETATVETQSPPEGASADKTQSPPAEPAHDS